MTQYQVIYRKASGTEWRNFGGLKKRGAAFVLAGKMHSQYPRWDVNIRFIG